MLSTGIFHHMNTPICLAQVGLVSCTQEETSANNSYRRKKVYQHYSLKWDPNKKTMNDRELLVEQHQPKPPSARLTPYIRTMKC